MSNQKKVSAGKKEAVGKQEAGEQKAPDKKKEGSGAWIWMFGLVGVVLAVVALNTLRQEPDAGPPPPQPLSMPELAPHAPPPAPMASPAAEAANEPSSELMARETAMLNTAAKNADKPLKVPPLRRDDSGIAPKGLSRRSTGRSAGNGVSDVQLVATYQGKTVSAPVEIDGVYRGNTPLALTLPAGSHEIRIDHKRTRVNQFATQVDGGKSVELKVDLRAPSEARGNPGSTWGKKHRH